MAQRRTARIPTSKNAVKECPPRASLRSLGAYSHQLVADRLDVLCREARQFFGVADQQGHIAEAIDLAGDAVREMMQGIQRREAKRGQRRKGRGEKGPGFVVLYPRH